MKNTTLNAYCNRLHEFCAGVLRRLVRSYGATLPRERRALLEQFELTDIARKVVGVGSVGTRAWIVLLLGRDGHDPLFLQIKEAEASVLEEFLEPSEFDNHGERVVTGQHLMQASSDIFLGWLHVESGLEGRAGDYYGRQLKDWKGSAEIGQMSSRGLAQHHAARSCFIAMCKNRIVARIERQRNPDRACPAFRFVQCGLRPRPPRVKTG